MAVGDAAGQVQHRYSNPIPITQSNGLDGFDCGKQPLDDWLRTHALANEDKASRTYVVTVEGGTEASNAVAYYTLAYGSVILAEMPRKIRHGLPNPVPVMILGRLAVDRRHSGRGLGPGLLREALLRTAQAAEIAGLRGLVVHAIDDEAIRFYAKYGFQVFPTGTRTMLLPIETIRRAIAD